MVLLYLATYRKQNIYLPLRVQKGVSFIKLSRKPLELQNNSSLLNAPVNKIRSVYILGIINFYTINYRQTLYRLTYESQSNAKIKYEVFRETKST